MLPDPLSSVLNAMLRRGPRTLGELAGDFQLSTDEMRQIAELLIGKGLLASEARAEDGECMYRVRLARTRELKASPDIWKALDKK